jgi:hypothetical protein
LHAYLLLLLLEYFLILPDAQYFCFSLIQTKVNWLRKTN